MKRGVVDKPITDTGTGALSGVTKTFGDIGNLFKLTLPSDLKSPFGDSSLELNLPIFNNLPKVDATRDGIKTFDVHFLGNMSISTGAFALVTAQFKSYNETKEGSGEDQYYHSARGGSLTAGAIATFSAEVMWANVIGYVSVDFGASLAVGLTMGMQWDNFEPDKSDYGTITWGGTTGLTILIRISVTISLGVGLKGICSASVSGMDYSTY